MSSLFTKEMAVKYGVRLTHMFTVIALSGRIFYQYLFESESAALAGNGSAFYAVMGVLLIVSGTINMFLQKPTLNMKEDRGPWMKTLYAKFAVTLLVCTPLPRAVGFSKEGHIALQFYFILAMIIVSPALRFYREHFTQIHKHVELSED